MPCDIFSGFEAKGFLSVIFVQSRDRVSILKEIAASRSDVILLSVREDESTFLQKIQAADKNN